MESQQQAALVRAVNSQVGLALRELAPDPAGEPLLLDLLAWMAGERIAAQLILYDQAEDVRRTPTALRAAGRLPSAAGASSTCSAATSPGATHGPTNLPFLAAGTDLDDWMLCAFGAQEAACVAAAALLGGDVRVGFENNLHLPGGKLAPSNADLVDAVAVPLGRLWAPCC